MMLTETDIDALYDQGYALVDMAVLLQVLRMTQSQNETKRLIQQGGIKLLDTGLKLGRFVWVKRGLQFQASTGYIYTVPQLRQGREENDKGAMDVSSYRKVLDSEAA